MSSLTLVTAPRGASNAALTRALSRSADSQADRSGILDQTTSDLVSRSTGGRPLPEEVRHHLEGWLDADLSAVRIHTDSSSRDLTRRVHAEAFTSGDEVFFGDSGFDPASPAGLGLLAHELTHVVQHAAGHGPRPGTVSGPADAAEVQAEKVAREVAGGRRPTWPANLVTATGAGVPVGSGVSNRAVARQYLLGSGGTSSERVARAVETGDAFGIAMLSDSDLREATVEQRISLIRSTLDTWWVGPSDESRAERIWSSFGDNLPEVVGDYGALWTRSLDRGVDPSEMPACGALRRAWAGDVKEMARRYMRLNLGFVDVEMTRLGLAVPEGTASPTATLEAELRLESVQALARVAMDTLAAQRALQRIFVGYDYGTPNPNVVIYDRATFDPARSPAVTTAPSYYGYETPTHTWAEVKAEWDKTAAVLNTIGLESPTVYAAVAQDREALSSLATSDAEGALAAARGVLGTTRANIVATLPKIDNGDLDWRDLVPIHRQLYAGTLVPGGSGVDWSQLLARSIAKDVIGDHETTEFWIALGLGALSAALFIVAEFATGGLATAALLGGIAVSGAQAVRSWENYEDLRTAADAEASSENELVSEDQADAALLGAILDTVFALLDVASPAYRLGRGALTSYRVGESVAERGAGSALEQGFRAGVPVAGEEAADLVQRGITELGVRETLERTGAGSAEDLLRHLPAGSAAAVRLRAFAEASLRPGELAAVIDGLPRLVHEGQIARDVADSVMLSAIEELGPRVALRRAGGWDTLVKALGDGSRSGEALLDYREAVLADLRAYVEGTLGGQMHRTGTAERFSNDLDLSFTGAKSVEVHQAAAQYLARVLGTDASPQSFHTILKAALFTDPRRLHAYDALPLVVRERVAARQAVIEEQLIWNRRLFDARYAADEALEFEIRAEMFSMGIEEFAYRPMNANELMILGRRQDTLHAALEESLRAGDSAGIEVAARELGESQALMNAANPDAYFSGGGVRSMVTARQGHTPFERLGLEEDFVRPAVEQYTALIDQLPKLDHAYLEVARDASPATIIEGMRSLGKYGQRLRQVTPGVSRSTAEQFDELVKACQELKDAADAIRLAPDPAPSLAEVLARDQGIDAVLHRARWIFEDLTEMQRALVVELRRGLSEAAPLADLAGELQVALRGHILVSRAQRNLTYILVFLARTVRAGSELAEAIEARDRELPPRSGPSEMGDFPIPDYGPGDVVPV